jgi:hypothetical protein
MEDTKLYVNLTDEQQAALDLLDKALDACMDARLKHTDVKDTTDVWLARIERQHWLDDRSGIAQELWSDLAAKTVLLSS